MICGLAARRISTLVPYRLAIAHKVSPATTTWVGGAGQPTAGLGLAVGAGLGVMGCSSGPD